MLILMFSWAPLPLQIKVKRDVINFFLISLSFCQYDEAGPYAGNIRRTGPAVI